LESHREPLLRILQIQTLKKFVQKRGSMEKIMGGNVTKEYQVINERRKERKMGGRVGLPCY
jgi:hypothetical protein